MVYTQKHDFNSLTGDLLPNVSFNPNYIGRSILGVLMAGGGGGGGL